ncbi:MAG: Stp1/IreP family PP2C-type Ser/Thr phosphatase [Acidaminococcaceae bacterium]
MRVVSRTNRGLVRENNEDSILVKLPRLFAIADGMGGHQAGEVASNEAVKYLNQTNFQGLKDEAILPFMSQTVQAVNAKIWQITKENKALEGMGTTLTMLYLLDDGRACVAHVGDTRIYLLQGTGLKKVTSDHSFVAELVRNKQITLAEAESHPQKNVITRAVGVAPYVEVDLFEFLLVGAKRLLLCSDGLTNMVKEDTIAELLAGSNLAAVADTLLNKALAAGGKDNISFIILDLEGCK